MRNIILTFIILGTSLSIAKPVNSFENLLNSENFINVTTKESHGETNIADASCYAYTTCYGGRQISCYAYGAACTWNVIPGVRVTCCESSYAPGCFYSSCF